MDKKAEESLGCGGCLGNIILLCLIVQPWFWALVAIIVFIIVIIAAITGIFFPETKAPTSNQANTTASSNTKELPNIQWKEIQTLKQPEKLLLDDNFLIIKKESSDINEQLAILIGQKDRVTHEIFCPGEKVYFCVSCQLGYHEDSWQYLNKKCEQCHSSNAHIHILPLTYIQNNKSKNSLA